MTTLPVFSDPDQGWTRFQSYWSNFCNHRKSYLLNDETGLAEWGAKLEHNELVFDTDADKLLFLLRWA